MKEILELEKAGKFVMAEAVRKLAAKKGFRSPDFDYPPPGLSNKGQNLWEDFWKKYGPKVLQLPEHKQWPAAVAIFRNYAMKHGKYKYAAIEEFQTSGQFALAEAIRIRADIRDKLSSFIYKAVMKKFNDNEARAEKYLEDVDEEKIKKELKIPENLIKDEEALSDAVWDVVTDLHYGPAQ